MQTNTYFFIRYSASSRSSDYQTEDLALAQAAYDYRNYFRSGGQPPLEIVRKSGMEEAIVIDRAQLPDRIKAWREASPNR
jgi:hypothetical protein